MSSYSSVTVWESHSHGLPQENKSIDSWEAQVTLQCAWTDRHTAANDILGNRREWPHGTGVKPTAREVGIRPLEGEYTVTGQCNIYDYALLDVQYSSEDRDLASDSVEPNVEFIPLDYKRFRWDDPSGDPLLEAEAPGKQHRSINIVRTLYNVAGPLPAVLLTGIGGCNDVLYSSSSLGLSFAPETLLYGGYNSNQTITTSGAEGYTLVMRFLYKPDGWNYFWRGDVEAWSQIYDIASTGDPYFNYPLTDFSALLY